jgi:hypothetical protein
MQAPEEVIELLRDFKDNVEVLLAMIEKTEYVASDVNEMYLVLSDATSIIEVLPEQFDDIVNALNDLGEAENDIHTSEEDNLER